MGDDGDGGISDLKEYSGTLVDFASSPLTFIREHVLQIMVGAILSILFGFLNVVDELADTLLYVVLGNAGAAVVESLSAIGGVPLVLIDAMNVILLEIASVGGVFSPLIYVGMWGVLVVLAVELVVLVWDVVKVRF